MLRLLFFLGVLACLNAACFGADGEPDLAFEKDIRPILKAHCFDCHGEDGARKGGLDLRLRRWIVQGGESGPAIVPGQPQASLLIELVTAGKMPKRDKKLTPDQIQLLERWVANGAHTARPEPDALGNGPFITEEERSFWAFQPLQKISLPSVPAGPRVRTPVDVFLLQSLHRQSLEFSPDADKLTLLRRAHFDLLGLPPTPDEVERFLADDRPDAYERMLDALLDSPHYGERWGRHWLDIAGYADSDGYSDADPPRPYAYKYRDYVIRAFNDDKPLDRFIAEQLAGDELARLSQADVSAAATNQLARDLLIATGFLRMAADGSATDAIDYDTVRNHVVADTIKIVSTSLLGLSVGCAQCHDHRYDPIPQTDYYRLRAALEPAYNWKNWLNPKQRLVSLYTPADREQAAAIEAEAQKLTEEKGAKQKQYIDEALTKHLEKFDAPLREKLRAAFDAPANQRTPEQKKLLADHPSVNIHPGVLYQYNQKAADDLKAMDVKIAEIRARKPPEDFISVLTEPSGNIPVTHLFHRGDHKQPRDAVPPGGLTVLARSATPIAWPDKDTNLATSGRRLALAGWLTHEASPLVARVFVNRVWAHHFGHGIVGTPSEFGTMGERPTHPELLDWLAGDFIAHGWRTKRLHRLIMTSTAYRQSSSRQSTAADHDPENRLYWRKPVVRLDAEVIRDAMLAVSGSLNPTMFGSPVPVRPDVHGQIIVGVDKTEGDNKMPVDVPLKGEEFRRSAYIQVRRSRPLAMLHAFDAPVMEVNCERRQSSTVATQSLMLMNSRFVLDQAAAFAKRLTKEAGSEPARQIDLAWRLAFSRRPTDAESTAATDFLQRQVKHLSESAAAKSDSKPASKLSPDEQALTNLCQALLSANEFLYID